MLDDRRTADGCEASFTVKRTETVTAVITVTPDSGCTIAFRSRRHARLRARGTTPELCRPLCAAASANGLPDEVRVPS